MYRHVDVGDFDATASRNRTIRRMSSMRHSALDRARTVAVSGTRRAARMVRRAARPVASRRPGRLGVLAYHRVATLDHDPWSLSVTPEHFDGHMAVLRELGRVDRLDEALGTPTLEPGGRSG